MCSQDAAPKQRVERQEDVLSRSVDDVVGTHVVWTSAYGNFVQRGGVIRAFLRMQRSKRRHHAPERWFLVCSSSSARPKVHGANSPYEAEKTGTEEHGAEKAETKDAEDAM